MNRIFALLSVLVIGLALISASRLASEISAAVPPRPNQPHPDIFTVAGIADMQTLNPLTQLLKSADNPDHVVRYRLLTMPGCITGTVPADLDALTTEVRLIKVTFVRDDGAPNFTIRINCGSEQIRICGAVTIFCLGRGFPYTPDVEISDIISSYPPTSRLSILCHEICGHAFATWNEQYCLGGETSGVCKGLAQFTPAPSWADFMNTGELSRHGIEGIELERWERTMFAVATECVRPGFDPCTHRWFMADDWSWDPVTGSWWNPDGKEEWTACNKDGLRWNLQLLFWAPSHAGFFVPSRGFWSFAPPCS